MSYSSHVILRNIRFRCDRYFDVVKADDQYRLSDFTFDNLRIEARDTSCRRDAIERFTLRKVSVKPLAQ